MLEITERKGFKITFENNLCVSVQFGSYNYCSNRNLPSTLKAYSEDYNCKNAEIAIWDTLNRNNGEWLTKKFINCDDDVTGWVSPDMIADIIYKVKNWKRGKRIKRLKF